MRSRLADAVEVLYAAFARYPLLDNVEYCDHCVSPSEVADLHRTPLRDLTAGQLGPLLFNATTTWGDQAYLNHFLPRLLELTANGEMETWSYPSFLPLRLQQPWSQGSQEEKEALDHFAATWWQETITTWPSACDAWSVLDTLSQASRQPLADYLAGWPLTGGEPGARQLASLVTDLMHSSDADEADLWLLGPVPQQILGDAIASASTPEIATELHDAYEHLTLHRHTA